MARKAQSAATAIWLRPRSDQGDDFPLRLVIALDVARGRSQARMSGELLNIPEAPTNFTDFSGSASDKSSTTAVA